MSLILRAAVAALALLPLACTAAPEEAYKLGTHYTAVRTAQAPANPARVTVEEAFWYGCPHCFHFDPYVEKWLKTKPAYVDFTRVPASLGRPIGQLHSKAFYAARTLGKEEAFHLPLFRAIHEQRKPMDTANAVAELFAAVTGLKAAEFTGTLDSFIVDSEVRRAEVQLRDYGLSSVPTVIVGGAYQTNATTAGGLDKVFAVVDFLADKVRKERRTK